jgi:GTPase SAR1 family protein
MSEFNKTWRRYNLKCTPYFITPLTIDGGLIDLSNFVGRDIEKEKLKGIIGQGAVRCLVVGDPGVGKTSLVNFVREKASRDQYFTPQKEIEINKPISCNEFIIITLSAIYEEVKRQNINLSKELTQNLDALYSVTQLVDFSENQASITHLNYNKLFSLYQKTIKEVIHPRFKGIILHYDNFDNITNPEAIYKLFGEVRDLLSSSQDVIFFFVGNRFLPRLVSLQPRVRQVFLMPPIEISALTIQETKKILEKRINNLKERNLKPIAPHTDKAVEVLFELHSGNLREILNSLSNCVLELPPTNSPIQIDEFLVRDLLFKKVESLYLSKLTEVEKRILFSVIDKGLVTPSEIAELNKISRQNISSKYLPKLEKIGTIEFRGKEGRNVFYEINEAIKWWKLQLNETEKRKMEEQRNEKNLYIIQNKLTEFM